MRKLFLTLIIICIPSQSHALNIFACEPEWKALAEEIGGDKVDAVSATTAFQDPHHIRAKPSLLAQMRRADLVICSGSGLEAGWLPILLQKSGSASVQPGQVGNLEASKYIDVLDKHGHVDRSMGDVHPEGNPHIHLDPRNILKVGEEVNKRMQQIDADNASVYDSNFKNFSEKWNGLIASWQADAAQLKNAKVIAYHSNFNYLFNWLGIKQVANLEPKPGLPPTVSHLEEVLKTARSEKPYIIINSSYESDDAAKWLSDKSKIKAVKLPYTIGGNDDADSLESLFSSTIKILKQR